MTSTYVTIVWNNYVARICTILTCMISTCYYYTLSQCLDAQHSEGWSSSGKTVWENCHQPLEIKIILGARWCRWD
ncbi:hypothetical protein I79_011320 [Cricetulus griseus]|uniref:Uncharacterized protein n=1 Tax=Cricetulus griseus TaxID=10029 RepID=G3HKU0_CRIGR|nr:hypothetical protein I79_011320 [Cricetulus griseus]